MGGDNAADGSAAAVGHASRDGDPWDGQDTRVLVEAESLGGTQGVAVAGPA